VRLLTAGSADVLALAYLLEGSYGFNELQIGLFGLAGLLGVLLAPLIGKFVDRLAFPWLAIVRLRRQSR